MDEPTSALSAAEVDQLFAVIDEPPPRRHRDRLHLPPDGRDREDRGPGDRAAQRPGRGEFDARDLTAEKAAEAMVGTKVEEVFNTRRAGTGEELLRLSGFALQPRRTRTGRREPNGIDLTVHRGEIVGLCGLLGAGRTELLETLFGAGTPGTWRGTVTLDGRPVLPRNPRQALRAGIAFVPEDRRMAGLVLEHSVLANTVLSVLDRLGAAGLVRKRKERSTAAEVVRRLNVKLGRLTDPVGSLSGGNQQKVVFGRMLLTEPRLLLLDDPTRGVDIGAKAEIYQLLQDIAARDRRPAGLFGDSRAGRRVPPGGCAARWPQRTSSTPPRSVKPNCWPRRWGNADGQQPRSVAGTSGADASGGGR